MITEQENPFIVALLELESAKDLGTLAALRSGLGKEPGEASRMLPFVARYLGTGEKPRSKQHIRAMFLTASLFALHRIHSSHYGDLGRSARELGQKQGGSEGVERRFSILLDADPEDLPHQVTGFVQQLASASVPVDWQAFVRDMTTLLGEDEERRRWIRTRWARSFWGRAQDGEKEQINGEENQQ